MLGTDGVPGFHCYRTSGFTYWDGECMVLAAEGQTGGFSGSFSPFVTSTPLCVRDTKKTLGTFPRQCWQNVEKLICHIVQGPLDFMLPVRVSSQTLWFTLQLPISKLGCKRKSFHCLHPLPFFQRRCTTCSNLYKLKGKFFFGFSKHVNVFLTVK